MEKETEGERNGEEIQTSFTAIKLDEDEEFIYMVGTLAGIYLVLLLIIFLSLNLLNANSFSLHRQDILYIRL